MAPFVTTATTASRSQPLSLGVIFLTLYIDLIGFSIFFPVGPATRDHLRQRLGFSGKVVLALGRIASNKGYDLLIKAFAEAVQREPSAHLYLALGGERLDAGEEATDQQIDVRHLVLVTSDHVLFRGG